MADDELFRPEFYEVLPEHVSEVTEWVNKYVDKPALGMEDASDSTDPEIRRRDALYATRALWISHAKFLMRRFGPEPNAVIRTIGESLGKTQQEISATFSTNK